MWTASSAADDIFLQGVVGMNEGWVGGGVLANSTLWYSHKLN